MTQLIDIPSLPSASFFSRLSLPNTGGIYFIVDPFDKRLCYIGKAWNLRARWNAHHRAPQMHATMRIHWIECTDEGERGILEDQFIAHYRPPWNNATAEHVIRDLTTRIVHMQLEIDYLRDGVRRLDAQWWLMAGELQNNRADGRV